MCGKVPNLIYSSGDDFEHQHSIIFDLDETIITEGFMARTPACGRKFEITGNISSVLAFVNNK